MTSISDGAFMYCKSLTVNIPSSVTSIGNYAFGDLPSNFVKQVNVPTGDTALENLVKNSGYPGTIGHY